MILTRLILSVLYNRDFIFHFYSSVSYLVNGDQNKILISYKCSSEEVTERPYSLSFHFSNTLFTHPVLLSLVSLLVLKLHFYFTETKINDAESKAFHVKMLKTIARSAEKLQQSQDNSNDLEYPLVFCH